jgi:hypothetical protein
VSVNEFALVRGLRDTRGALTRWNADPWPVLRSWLLGAAAVAAALLVAVWLVAEVGPVDISPLYVAGLSSPAELEDVGGVLWRNSIVLALHATACVAGFIAGSALPVAAARRSGISRWIHERARPIALAWVIAVTVFSLATQALALGLIGGQLAYQLEVSPGTLLVTALPHAIPELVALFLPLAAWTIAGRREEWSDLLAATFTTVAVAIPILVVAATWEVYVWPQILSLASPAV